MANGKADRSEGRVGLLLLSLIAMILLIVGRTAAKERRAAPLLTADVQAPVAAFLSRPFRAVESSLADAEDRAHAIEENRALRAELAELRRESRRLAAMRARLARLETALGIPVEAELSQPRIIARVVSDPGSPFVRSYLLAAGAEQGIKPGYAVLNEAGMVGHVTSAGRRSARVLRLDDLNSRIAVMSERSEARAILSGANGGPPVLRFVADPEGWDVGDTVLTSGDDGRLPAGLTVGQLEADGRVALAFTQAPSDWVAVIPFERVGDPEDVEGAVTQGDDADPADAVAAPGQGSATATAPAGTGAG